MADAGKPGVAALSHLKGRVIPAFLSLVVVDLNQYDRFEVPHLDVFICHF